MYKIIVPRALLVIIFLSWQIPLVKAADESTGMASSTIEIPDRAAVERRVREYFVDVPVMIDIARCESSFRQFSDSGSVFHGGSGGGMVGVFQLYGSVHAAAAIALGLDINTLEGNIAYARHLYESSGVTPWHACVPAEAEVTTQIRLRIELMKRVISLLQQLLALMTGAT